MRRGETGMMQRILPDARAAKRMTGAATRWRTGSRREGARIGRSRVGEYHERRDIPQRRLAPTSNRVRGRHVHMPVPGTFRIGNARERSPRWRGHQEPDLRLPDRGSEGQVGIPGGFIGARLWRPSGSPRDGGSRQTASPRGRGHRRCRWHNPPARATPPGVRLVRPRPP